MMRKGKRKIFLALVALGLFAALTITGTFALLTRESEIAANSIKVAKVDVENEEPNFSPDISPGATVYKDPRIKNSSTARVYVRMIVAGGIDNPSWEDPILVPVYDGTLPEGAFPSPPTQISPAPTPSFNPKWHQDPYDESIWYYEDILEPGESTEPLFTSVTLSEGYAGDGRNLNVIIYSEGIQADYLNGSVGIDGLDNAKAAFNKLKKAGSI
ncbi:MAG: hypothetical protein LBU32_26195 [Clostridiales bacterium]|jgi:hypothetical protein|nr:hypothetical protein [Clostridiales bacterium]